ncbi:MAG: ferrous iron transporter B [Epulopiscium sp.]|jgi:ferrous iron transport protein B|nr:ferrous iron transporter B [Candidatus Epulonipiscium sp.]
MAGCHEVNYDEKIYEKHNKILLMGNPNVGKSVFFSNMTGIHVVSSNYAGTTVSYTEGTIKLNNETYTLIDVPGIYSLEATSEAEAVAVSFLNSNPVAILCVLDATNLERNIKLGLELKKFNIPIVFALNLLDVAKRHGLEINVGLLAKELGAPVIPTVAVKEEGINELKEELQKLLSHPQFSCSHCDTCPGCPKDEKEELDSWNRAKEITAKVRKNTNGELSFLDRLGNSMLRPWPGIPIALFAIILSLAAIVGGGKALRAVLLLPLVNNILVPFFKSLFASFIPEGVFLNVLIGEYGIFVIGFEWIIALIFPYVFLFYVVFSFLEDSGILPRLSVLFDNIMRKMGIQGGSMITILMGYGCAVPAIIGSRAATTKKERLIISTIVCFAVPCISQTGALISLFAGFSPLLLILMILLSFVIMVTVSSILGRVLKGTVDPMVIEIPNLLLPNAKAYGKKLMIRMQHFLLEAEVPMLISIIIAALLKETGLLANIAVYLEPIVSGWLGLPKDAVIALILGIVRREMAVAPLLAIEGLTALQAFVGGTVALLYLPCLSVFGILTKEFGTKVAVSIGLSTVVTAFTVAGLINQIAHIFI